MSETDATREAVVQALRVVKDPQSGRDVVSLGYAHAIVFDGGTARITYELPPQAATPDLQEQLRKQTKAALAGLDGVRAAEVEFSIVERRASDALPGVKHVVAVGAGKGGVGKSTIALAAAVGLRRKGLRVGLLDADVYGPSLPKLTGTEGAEPTLDDKGRVIPPEFDGIRTMSMGYLVPPNQAVIWRGPMAQKYVKEFLDRGAWGELDYLIVDLPPGTGDIPLTLAQSIPLTGALIVCTPQDVALLDAVKALRMYQKLGVEPLGMVENMSYYLCPHCGERDPIFGQGGVEKVAAGLGVPFLGGIPLNISIRASGDAGRPSDNFTQADRGVVEAFEKMVEALHTQVEARGRQRVPLPQVKVTS